MRRFFLSILLPCFLLSLPTGAQTRFEILAEEDFWQQSRYINGVRAVPLYSGTHGLSFSEILAGDVDGSFLAGARAGSLVHLRKTSLLGTLSLLNASPEDKAFRTFDFSGGVTSSLDPSWSIGTRMNMGLWNHRLCFSFEPSFLYRHDNWRGGLSLLFQKPAASFGERVFFGAALQASLMEKYSAEAAYSRSPDGADRFLFLAEYRLGGQMTQIVRLRFDGWALPVDGMDPKSLISLSYKGTIPSDFELDVRLSYLYLKEGHFEGGISIWKQLEAWRVLCGAVFRQAHRNSLRLAVRRDLPKGFYLQAEGGLRIRFSGGLRFGKEF